MSADAPPADGPVTVRRVATLAEYRECVAIQRETWGADFGEYVAPTVLLVAQKIGGVVAAAFAPNDRMLGFVFGMAGVLGGRPVHWSDMLAVRPEARGSGLGERLKRCQRALAREAGAEAMYWTFDPLVARNAHLNLVRLGARAVEYVPDMYGSHTGSPLHGGLPTDRLVARWELAGDAEDGPTRDGLTTGGPAPAATVVAADGTPRFVDPPADAAEARVPVPHDFAALPPALQAAWRSVTRAAFLALLGRGYAVAGFQRGDARDIPGLPYYELARPSPRTAA